MTRGLGLLVMGMAAGCASVPALEPARAREAYESARQRAFAPRRFKALFRGEASRKVGALVRGYLSVWWDGQSMRWKTSAPLAGAAQSGVLRLTGGSSGDDTPLLLPGRDAIGAVLGVLNRPGGEISSAGGATLVALEGGRLAVLDGKGNIVELRFPADRVTVTLEPGAGVPRRIEATSPEGIVVLVLESYLPWPEGEKVP